MCRCVLDDMQGKENTNEFTSIRAEDQISKCEDRNTRSVTSHGHCSLRYRLLCNVLSGFVLISAFFCGPLLLALSYSATNHTYRLLGWATDKPLPSLESVMDIPIACDKAISGNGGPLYRIPFLVAFMAPSDRSCSHHLAVLTRKFFAALFGPEKALSFSYILLLGTQSGHVFYCDLKRSVCVDGKAQQCSTNVLCCLEQPILLLSQFRGLDSRSTDRFLFLGVGGKLILCMKGDSNPTQVIFKQFCLLGPISSAVYVDEIGLVCSTLSSVKLVCLNQSCLSFSKEEATSLSSSLESAFESPVIISQGSFNLIHVLEPNLEGNAKPLFQIVAVDAEDEVCLVSLSTAVLSLTGTSHGQMPIGIVKKKLEDLLKASVLCESSCGEVEREVKLVHTVIHNVGSSISLFSSVAAQRWSPLGNVTFQCEVGMLCKRKEFGMGQTHLLLTCNVNYGGCIPLGKGLSVILLVSDSEHQQSISAIADVSGLGRDKRVELNYPVPHSQFSLDDRIVIDLLLHFNPCLNVPYGLNNFVNWCGVCVQLYSACVTVRDTG